MHWIRPVFLLSTLVLTFSFKSDTLWDPEQLSLPKSPQEEAQTFVLQPGFKAELIAAEPLVQDPVAMQFDAHHRLWVVEMRGFMPDIDGKGEKEPIGRINVLEDLNSDGKMDKSTIYLDGLVLPRSIGLFKNGALVASDRALFVTYDDNGDLKADRKVLLDSTYSKNGLPEHSDNGLLRNLDNWYYNVKSRLRYRYHQGQWERDSTEFRGQWGMSKDNQGRLFYNYNWSQLHADLVPPNTLNRNRMHQSSSGIDHGLSLDRRIYPIRPNLATNRGYIPSTLTPDGRIKEFTSACSPLVLRSKAYGPSHEDNVFVCEPAANLIKRNVLYGNALQRQAKDPLPGKEFMASTDERFRPVNLSQGPDGALYVADMYRGLIQHGAYVTPYLREMTLKRQLVYPIHMGRIWRIVPINKSLSRAKPLGEQGPGAWVQALASNNGWVRDMAQQLLIDHQAKDQVPALRKMLQKAALPWARLHALWTLEALGQADANDYDLALKDAHVAIREAGLRLMAEHQMKLNAKQRILVKQGLKQGQASDVLAPILYASLLPKAEKFDFLSQALQQHGHYPLVRDAVLSGLGAEEHLFLNHVLPMAKKSKAKEGVVIAMEMLANAGLKRKSLGAEQLNQWMMGMPAQDPLVLALQNALRVHRPEAVSAQGILDPAIAKQFALGRQKYLATCVGCHGSDGAGVNRMGPPLVASEWVNGDELTLTLLVLHGMEGAIKVNQKLYDAPQILPVMPAHSTMDDADLAAILTYIRNAWGNRAPAISGRNVGATRHSSQGRVMPWTAKELQTYVSAKRADEQKK